MASFVCSSSTRLNISHFCLCNESKRNIQLLWMTSQRLSPAVCNTVFSCGPGTRINQLTINYVGQCVAVWEKLSVSLWIWLWLNWHCSSPRSERGFAQRVLQHCCDCVGEGKAGVCSLWFIFFKRSIARTVCTCAAFRELNTSDAQ